MAGHGVLDDVGEVLGVRGVSGHHHRRAGHERGQRNAPAQDVVDRHSQEEGGVVLDAEAIGRSQPQGVQPQGAVRVHHALRRPGRAGGVAQCCRRGFREIRPVVDRGPFIQQRLVVGHVDPAIGVSLGEGEGDPVLDAGDIRGAGPDEDHALHGGALGEHLDQAVGVHRVTDDDAVLGVIDGVDDLVVGELPVQRLEDRTHRRGRQQHLQVLGAVDHQGCHPVADADAEVLGQRVGECGHARPDLLEGRDLRLGSQVRGHRAVAVRIGAVGQDLRYGKGAFLHRRFHGVHLSPRLRVPFLYDATSPPTRWLGHH